jgi:hypothetical protein
MKQHAANKQAIHTLQQEAEHVEEEQDARSVQISEESLVVHDGEGVSGDIADDV